MDVLSDERVSREPPTRAQYPVCLTDGPPAPRYLLDLDPNKGVAQCTVSGYRQDLQGKSGHGTPDSMSMHDVHDCRVPKHEMALW